MRTSFIDTLCEVAADDSRVWLLTGDLGFSVLERFYESHPDRYVNIGVAEQNMTGIAAGLAHSGKIVFTYSIANFPTLRCLEQIRNDVCYHELPVKVVSVGGGFAYGSAGYTHHALEDLAVMSSMPGMTVVAPGDPIETELATRAIAGLPGPAYLRLGKAGEPVVHATVPRFEIGKALCVRQGQDLTFISTGGMLHHAVEVANSLAADHQVETRVLSMHTLKPLDTEAVIAAIRETTGIVTVEEHSAAGGLSSAVARVVAGLDGPRGVFRSHSIPDRLSRRVGSQSYLRELAGDLSAAALSLLRAERDSRSPTDPPRKS